LALIKSISGIRGTIGGPAGTNLTPHDILESTAAFATWLLKGHPRPKVVIGRDARMSGHMVKELCVQTLIGMGVDVVDLDLSTTPTVEMAVVWEQAQAGIIVTASHNPREWNALKFVDHHGEFISKRAGEELLELIEEGAIEYAGVDKLGAYSRVGGYIDKHIETILQLDLVRVDAIRQRSFVVAVDPINSTGALAVGKLLEQLGCQVHMINDRMDGNFAHNPEPLPGHLRDLSQLVQEKGADLGIAVDPDVDRLAFVSEDGTMFGEEYTLVAVADYVLGHRPGNTVSNLSSTRALRDVTLLHKGEYHASAVGEVNVVTAMKAVEAVIGGEGNGGIILPELHYGRDALVGIALFLSLLVEREQGAARLRASYPEYKMVKDKIQLDPAFDLEAILQSLSEKYKELPQNTVDGLKIEFDRKWVHLRKSNTEPIIRVYAEAETVESGEELVAEIKGQVTPS